MTETHLNLDAFFNNCSQESYCIIKLDSRFPEYSMGSDVDIFSYDSVKFSKKILEIGNSYTKDGYSIKTLHQEEYHRIFIDFFRNDSLEFRFDIYQKLPDYKKLKIKPCFFNSVIENSNTISRTCNGENYSIYVPNNIDEMIIRYIEFIEWYDIRPDKLKHLEYILNNIQDNERGKFFDRLHFFTEVPNVRHSNNKMDKFVRRILKKFDII